MCNCGRGSYTGSSGYRTASADVGPRRRTPRPDDDVVLHFLGAAAILLKGPVSRRVYALRPDAPLVSVDAEDVTAFVNSPLFEPHAER